ncbi:hypothetical protein [Streptomyces sp. AC550_RSS872]|uniref:hypothetical protein n=1 Tax=Streptomyces sp. AC550_RSS872 TaxID=2823689 RepID=UPI001C27758A|nr:hypothetical protein [Streptomyces sp. AC550_RSS872]
MTDQALRLLRESARLAELAAFPFNFDIGRAAHGNVEEVRTASGDPLGIVAGDDTGGRYFVCADGSMLYADSEGSAGNTALQEKAGGRVSARLDQARPEREDAQLAQAIRSLEALRGVLAAPGDDSLCHWQGVNLGRFIAEEHYSLTRALADARHPEEARALLKAADAILGELSENAANGARELAEGTAARVREIS